MPSSARRRRLAILSAAPALLLLAACGKKHDDHAGHDHAHEAKEVVLVSKKHGHSHTTPHGGTPVVLGDEAFHLELVRDPARGVLQAFVLDGHLENFIRSAAPSFEVIATVVGEKRPLVFKPVSDAATGEKPGDASLFEAQAEWLKTTGDFDAVLVTLDIRGATFADVPFKFPGGKVAD